MLNILEVHPKETGIPKEPLRRAAEKLKQVAERVAFQEAEARRIRNRYISRALPNAPPPPPQSPSIDQFTLAIRSKITGLYGRKGPTENAFNELKDLATRAHTAGYPLKNTQLQDAFVNFLMSYVTEGFVGVDTTGTQMGNFKGKWHGGGFN